MKILLTFLLMILAFQFSFGQEKPKAELQEIIGPTNNDNLLSRVQNLSHSLEEKDTAYIVISSTDDNQLFKYKTERKIKGCFYPKFPSNKLVIVYDENKNEDLTEFWRVPFGAIPPRNPDETKKDFTLSKSQNKVLLYSGSWEEDYCRTNFDLEFYSKFLLANPHLFGKISVLAKTQKQGLNKVFSISQTLIKKFKVPKSQLKISYTWNNVWDYEDYWLVPKKKSH